MINDLVFGYVLLFFLKRKNCGCKSLYFFQLMMLKFKGKVKKNDGL